MIRFSGVSYDYPGTTGAIRALDGVDLELGRGELVVVLGANGSGKSTLARLANGVLVPSAGSVSVDELTTSDAESVWLVRRRVGLVSQNPDNQIVGTSVEEDVAFGPENLGLARPELRDRVDRALAAVGLTDSARREPHQLSGGQKQRLAIASALAMDPDYLVFDEPTAMLDPQGRNDVLDAMQGLRGRDRGVLHITHDLTDIEGADRVLVLVGGRVAFDGTPDDLVRDVSLPQSLGVAVPPALELNARLRARGVPLSPAASEPAKVVDALWR